MADSRTAIIVAGISALAVLGAALIANLDKLTGSNHGAADSLGQTSGDGGVANDQAAGMVTPPPTIAPQGLNTGNSIVSVGETTGQPYSQSFEDIGVTLRFVPTRSFRRLIEYRTTSLSTGQDISCTAPYSAQERVTRIAFSWGFVIDRFWTWNEREGQQEYIIDEGQLPNAWQGSLHDLVKEGRTLTLTKQRCGQGQVASFVAVGM